MTDEHAAGEQSAETVALLRIAGRVAQLGGWTIHLPSRALTWSDETCAIHDLPAGYKPTLDEGLGYFPPEYRAEVVRHLEACERDGTGYDFEVPKLTATGRRIWVRSIGEAVRDAEGRIVGLQGAFQDITTRRQAEAALRASEAEFRALAESMPQMVWMARPDRWNTYFNQRWVDYTGLSLEESYGHGWNTPFHPDDRQRAWEAWQQAIADGDYHVECRLRAADGSYRWMLVRGLPLRDGAGHTVKWIGTFTDIDDLKQAQEAARTQAHMLDQIGQAVIATDTGGRVTYANRFAGELYGWTPEEMVGRLITEVTVPQVSQDQGREIMALLQRGETWSGEFLVQNRDGRVFPAHVTDSPVLDGQGQLVGIVGISADISARKQLEQHYLRAQRMESIGTLASGIAHDLNNVLAPILLSIGLLQEDERDADRLEILGTVGASAKRGAAMVGRLMSFARGAESRLEDMQVPPLVQDLVTIVRDTFPKNIAFESRLTADLWDLQADATQLHQVLLNLCVNARDAMPDGGKITLAAKNIVIDEAYAALNLDARSGPYVNIAVEDTGAGIPKAIIDKIFDPFFTTKDIGKGTGLGLATSLAIVTGHKGFMRVSSEPGAGSRFEVNLPAQTTRAKPASPAPAAVYPRGQGETVLVVDDEAGIRQIAQRTLTAFGYRVLLASDGAEAVALYAQHQAEIAVVLTDMMMPVKDGTATIQELVRLDPQVRIIGASGLATDARAAGAAAARVMYFLAKPYTAETLLTAVRAALPPSA